MDQAVHTHPGSVVIMVDAISETDAETRASE